MRLKEDARKVTMFDLAHPYAIGASYKNSEATRFSLEGSADGRTWHSITNVSDLAYKNNVNWHYSQAEIPSATVTGALPVDTTIPVGERKTVLPNGIPCLKVAVDATFEVVGSPLEVKGLEIAASGAGSVRNVTFAGSGTINVTDVDMTQREVNVPFDFSTLGGAENLVNWTVTVNGSARDTEKYAATVSSTGIRLSKRGMVLLVR